jgi:hypothetical protein
MARIRCSFVALLAAAAIPVNVRQSFAQATADPISLGAPTTTNAIAPGDRFQGPGANDATNKKRIEKIDDGKGMGMTVDVEIGAVDWSAAVSNEGPGAGNDRLRLLASAVANRSFVGAPAMSVPTAGTTDAFTVVRATSDFTLGFEVGAGMNKKFVRRWSIFPEAKVSGRLEGSRNGVAGNPQPNWQASIESALDIVPSPIGQPPAADYFTYIRISHKVLDRKSKLAQLQNGAALNQGTGPASINVPPQELSFGPTGFRSQPGDFSLFAELTVAASAGSLTPAAGLKGSRAGADVMNPANSRTMDVDLKARASTVKEKPKAYSDPLMFYTGSTITMDDAPLAALVMDDSTIYAIDDPSPGDALLQPQAVDPESVLFRVGAFNHLSFDGLLHHFSDASLQILVNGAPVISAIIENITATLPSLLPEDGDFSGHIQVLSADNSMGSAWMSQFLASTNNRFSFDPEFINATNNFSAPPAEDFFGVNLIVVPEPATLIIAAAALVLFSKKRRE